MSPYTPSPNENEKELFALISRGDEAAFTKIFHEYNKRLYPFVLKMIKSGVLAEEIVQNVFVRLWTNRGQLSTIENHQAYIFTIAANSTRDHLKKLASEARVIKEVMQSMPDRHSNDVEDLMLLNECRSILDIAVEMLPPQRQLIFRLSREEGKNYDEIAAELRISKNTVRNQLVEALRYIRGRMQNVTGSVAFVSFLSSLIV